MYIEKNGERKEAFGDGNRDSVDEFSTSTNAMYHRFEQVNIEEYSAPNRSMKFHWFVLAENHALNYSTATVFNIPSNVSPMPLLIHQTCTR